MIVKKVVTLLVGMSFFVNAISYGAQTIVAKKVEEEPVIDGVADEPVWTKAKEIVTHDKIAKIDVVLRALYGKGKIFFLVEFPDPTESRNHKTLIWNKALGEYETGPDREDSFVFKWNMMLSSVDLSVKSDTPYEADIWFWKAHRTDPKGFADDKRHILSILPKKDSLKQISKEGKIFYLTRPADKGLSVYKLLVYSEYEGDRVPKYEMRLPTESRADIRAKGGWQKGKWTVEFERALNTGHNDDIQFVPSESYLFGISKYEIAGRMPNMKQDQPFFGAGDVTETITLVFEK